MQLYHRWKCPWCAAARQAIENVGAPVELIEVPYDRDRRDAVMQASGQRRVPVLVDGGTVVVDSRRIVRHLYANHGDPSFARSISELDKDIAEEGETAAMSCELGPPPR